MNLSRGRAVAAIAIATLVLVATQVGAFAATHSVSIKDIAYNPSSMSIHVGDKVTWTNAETGIYAPQHTVTSDDGHSFDSGYLNQGNSFSFTFTKAGSFTYHCNVHSSMHGTITVLGATASSPTPTPTHSRPKASATATAKPTVPASPTPTRSVKPSPRASHKSSPSASTHATTAPTPSSTRVVASGSTGSGSTGAVAGVVAGAILLLAATAFAVRRRRTVR